MENEKQVEIVEEVNEEVVEEAPANEQEQEQEQELPDLVTSLTKEYEKRLEEQKNGYEKQIAERDKIITQIISGSKATGKPNDRMQAVIDKINEKRTYKKW